MYLRYRVQQDIVAHASERPHRIISRLSRLLGGLYSRTRVLREKSRLFLQSERTQARAVFSYTQRIVSIMLSAKAPSSQQSCRPRRLPKKMNSGASSRTTRVAVPPGWFGPFASETTVTPRRADDGGVDEEQEDDDSGSGAGFGEPDDTTKGAAFGAQKPYTGMTIRVTTELLASLLKQPGQKPFMEMIDNSAAEGL